MTIQQLCRSQFEGLGDRIKLGRAATRLNAAPEGLGQRQMFGARQERVRSPGGGGGVRTSLRIEIPLIHVVDTRSSRFRTAGARRIVNTGSNAVAAGV